MPGSIPGILWVKDDAGEIHEVINQARTAAYLQNSDLAIPGLMPCDVADYGGCAAYALFPRCGDEGGWIDTPGVTGNGVSVADTATLDITGDLTLIVQFRLDDPTPAGSIYFLGKGTTYRMGMTSAGLPLFEWVNSGGTPIARTGDEDIRPLIAAATPYIAGTLDVDNGAAGHSVRWWYSWNGVDWTQIGSTNTTAGTTTVQNSANDFYIGASATSNQVAGEWYYAAINNSIGTAGLPGIPSLNFEYDGEADLEGVAAAATTFTSTSGHTVNIAHSGGTPTVVVPFLNGDDWDTLSFETPATDTAPWYSSTYPESADALGFYVEEWTGLDNKHITRTANRYGSPRGGATLGSISNAERTMKINIFLFARSEQAMDYLFYWLSTALSSVCGSCDSSKLLTRRFCGDVEDPWSGVVELRDVGLIEGLAWESDVADLGRCYIRHASFTLVAGDPCMYLSDSSPSVTETALASTLGDEILNDSYFDLSRIPCRPSCSELRATEDLAAYYTFDIDDAIGVKAPTITFSNTSDEYNYPFRAVIYADPGEIGVSPNPCGLLILCEIYVRPLPPDSTLQWDLAGRDIFYQDINTGGPISSMAFIDGNDPPIPRFAAFGCSRYHLALEPATLCVERVGVVGNVFEWQGITFSEPAYPDVEITVQERISCA